ncbi:hypothetical protein TIFTF001_000203 [Ficus carica]|uniref:Uncharacterized protein n=1 Tax=Ficus carica TaxID=3494 RepID=A0AA87Z190_FICCA|nr:hypothetical protein TIFTF001_000203 [Ficus carica]
MKEADERESDKEKERMYHVIQPKERVVGKRVIGGEIESCWRKKVTGERVTATEELSSTSCDKPNCSPSTPAVKPPSKSPLLKSHRRWR